MTARSRKRTRDLVWGSWAGSGVWDGRPLHTWRVRRPGKEARPLTLELRALEPAIETMLIDNAEAAIRPIILRGFELHVGRPTVHAVDLWAPDETFPVRISAEAMIGWLLSPALECIDRKMTKRQLFERLRRKGLNLGVAE